MKAPRRSWDRRDNDQGFTLIELAVAMLIMSVVLMSLGYVLTNAMVDTAYNRQRVEAVNLANQTVEEVRSLASTSAGWAQVLNSGMTSPDPNSSATPRSDPNIASGCFEGHPLDIAGSLSASCAGQAPLTWQDRSACTSTTAPPTASSLSSLQPLQPHEACYLQDGTTYIVDSYLTGTNTSGSAQVAAAPLSLTVVVSWTRPERGGAGTSADRVSTSTQLAGCSVALACT